MNQTVKVLCARCHVPLERVGEPDADVRAVCPTCGNGDELDAVMAEVSEYIHEVAAKKISETIQNSASGSSFIKINSGYTPSNRNWRFIADIEL